MIIELPDGLLTRCEIACAGKGQFRDQRETLRRAATASLPLWETTIAAPG